MYHTGGYGILITIVVLQCFICKGVCFPFRNMNEWMTKTEKYTEGDVTCFSEYMETWIHNARIEGLMVWLSRALKIKEVTLASLDHLNLQLSACGFSLHKDPDKNFVFRVSYTGCLVQQQHSFYILTLNLVKRINRLGGRPHSFIMSCPVASVLPNREQIQCDPEYIQVIRQVPYDNWNNEVHWSLSLSDHLVVALEDASLFQMNVYVNGQDISVHGRRSEVLSPVKVMENEEEFLALKLVSGQYSYSMEATCPKVITAKAEKTVLHIFKRPMGLTRRGSYINESLTVSNVSVKQTDDFTVHDTSGFLILVIPTDQILQTKTCAESKQLMQPFYRVDVVLTFKETNHKMHWTMENTLPCTGKLQDRAPGGDVNQFSTASFPHTQTEGSSFHLSGNSSAALNSETASFISELHNTTASANSSAEPDILESPGVTKLSSSTLFNTTVAPGQEHQQFSTTSGTKDQQGQKGLKLVW